MVNDVLSMHVRMLAELPLKSTVVARLIVAHIVDVEGRPTAVPIPVEERLYFTTSRACFEALATECRIVCSPLEYEALALALADGRCTRADAHRELAAKRSPLGHRIDLARLLDQTPVSRRCAVATVKGERGATSTRSVGALVTELEGGVRQPSIVGYLWTWRDFLDALGAEIVKVRLEEERAHG